MAGSPLALLFGVLLLSASSWAACDVTTCATFAFSMVVSNEYIDDTGVSFPISVSGMPASLASNAIISLQTMLNFPAAIDAYVTLTSPKGTTIIITSGNGQIEVTSALYGMTWRDDAPPVRHFHLIPITAGLTALSPDQPLRSFLGEDPNGDWVLFVKSEFQTFYPSYFDGWSINFEIPNVAPNACSPNPCQNGGICSASGTSFTCDCSNTGFNSPTCGAYANYTFSMKDVMPVADGDAVTPTVADLIVSGLPHSLDSTTKFYLKFDITADVASDLKIVLTSPSGASSLVMDNQLGLSGIYGNQPLSNTLWGDGFPSVTNYISYETLPIEFLGPEQPFAPLLQTDPNGIWTLEVYDTAKLQDATYPSIASNTLFSGFTLIFEIPTASNPIYRLDTFTSSKPFSTSYAQVSVTFVGSLGESGPHALGKVGKTQASSFPEIYLTQDIGSLWALRFSMVPPGDKWGIGYVNVYTGVDSISFGVDKNLKSEVVLEAPIMMTIQMTADPEKSTLGALYCAFKDVNGKVQTSKIQKGFAASAVYNFDIPFINLGEIASIVLGTYSKDAFGFDHISITKRGVTKVFRYSGVVSRSNNYVEITPTI